MIFILESLPKEMMIAGGIAFLVAMIFALSIHEFGHAYVAYKCGDSTAKLMGRMTINPLVHMDPIGLICCFLFGFGWAKPVPINPLHFKKYKKGIALTSIAGVTINFILAFFSCGFAMAMAKFANLTNQFLLFLYFLFQFSYVINLILAIFNLLPIYPLDGFRVLEASAKYDNKYVAFMHQYGSIILIFFLLLGSGILSWLYSMIEIPISLFWGLIF